VTMSIKLWQALLMAAGWIGTDIIRLAHGQQPDALVISGWITIAIFCAGLGLVAALNRWLS